MEHPNQQMIPEKTIMSLLAKHASRLLIILLLAGLCSCSVLPDKYLFPTVPSQNFVAKSGGIVFQKFTEDFLVDDLIGIHQLGSRQQKLKAMTGEISTALQTLIGNRLADHNHNVQLTDKQLWDLTVNGLEDQKDKAIIIGGHVRRLSVQASTIKALVATEYEFLIEIDCYIGKVDEKKVIKRTVRYSHKMLSFLYSQKEMEKLLDKFLSETAAQVVENIESFL